MSLEESFAFAPLTLLLKPGSGLRPIDTGFIWRQLVSHVKMKGASKDAS